MKLFTLISVSVAAVLSFMPVCFAATFETDVVDPADSNLRRRNKNKVFLNHGFLTIDHIHHQKDAEWNFGLIPKCIKKSVFELHPRMKNKGFEVETEALGESFMAEDDSAVAASPHHVDTPMLGCAYGSHCYWMGMHSFRAHRPYYVSTSGSNTDLEDDNNESLFEFMLDGGKMRKMGDLICSCLSDSRDPALANVDNCHFYLLVEEDDVVRGEEAQVV